MPRREGRSGDDKRGVGGCLRLLLGACSFVIGAAAAVLIFLGHIGGPRWTFERLADLRPTFLTVAVLALVGLLVARWWRWATALAIVAFAAAWTVAPLWFQPPTAPRPGGAELEIATFNLSSRIRVEELAAYLQESQPADVVVLVDSRPRIDEHFRRNDTGYEVVFPQPSTSNIQTTVLARVPVEVIGPVTLDAARDPRAVEFQVDIGGQAVRVLGVHTLSPRSRTRAATRNRELTAIADWAGTQQQPAIVLGDLNVTRWAPSFGLLTAGSGLVDSSLGYGLQPTWELDGLPLAFPIDHLLHSPSLTTTSRRIGPSFGSDHSMVLVTVAPADG